MTNPEIKILCNVPTLDQVPWAKDSICAALKEGHCLILNTSQMSETEAKRVFDYCCGVTYATQGHYLKLSNEILLFTPKSISPVEFSEYCEPKVTWSFDSNQEINKQEINDAGHTTK